MFPFSFISGGAGGLSPEALAWEANIIANGGTIDPAILAIFDEYFFIPAVANGNILTELDRLNIYCGLVGYEIAARTNLIKSAHYVTPVSSPTFDNNGYKSGGTSYLNLNFNQVTQGVKCLAANNNIGCIVDGVTYAAYTAVMGGSSGPNSCFIETRTNPLLGFFDNSNIVANSSIIPTGRVLMAMKKTSTIAGTVIVNTQEDAAVWTNFSNVNLNQYELTYNSGGSPAGSYDLCYHLCSWHGSANLDYAAMRTILLSLFTALGV
jgi:hypothetical protein